MFLIGRVARARMLPVVRSGSDRNATQGRMALCVFSRRHSRLWRDRLALRAHCKSVWRGEFFSQACVV